MTELELVLLLIPYLDIESVPEDVLDRMLIILGIDPRRMEKRLLTSDGALCYEALMSGMNFIRTDAPQPDLMGPDHYLKLLPSAAYDAFDRDGLRLWCNRQARYGLPTVELIEWLRTYIDGRDGIEIGSGSGDLCHHLGIRGTDSKLQNDPKAAIFYMLQNQPTIRYPASVERLEALEAITKYKPRIVVASWVTHWIDPDKGVPPGGGCMFGVHEDQLLATGAIYVFIGNLRVHQHKPILQLPHREIKLPFLRSRASDPSLDRVFIWNES